MMLNMRYKSQTLFILVVLCIFKPMIVDADFFDWLIPKSDTGSVSHQRKDQIERESQQNIQIDEQTATNFFRTLDRASSRSLGNQVSQSNPDKFPCVQISRELFEQFVKRHNRTFAGNADKLERLNLYYNTMRRAIIFNRVVQNDILNWTNYDVKPEIGNYHFITPIDTDLLGDNDIWFADLNDCELGMIKHILFEIMYLIDEQNFAGAYKMALDNGEYLPIFDAQGFKQISEILLLRLFERFKGDTKMNQLFQWPLYMKKLSSYAYNRLQVNQPNFKAKLALISFAYPNYFKDLKYNERAINRTKDNILVHDEHEQFNKLMRRKIANNKERNRRLVIFRERATLIRLLYESPNSWLNFTQQPEWQHLRKLNDLRRPIQDSSDTIREESSNGRLSSSPYKARLRLIPLTPLDGSQRSPGRGGGSQSTEILDGSPIKSQFSDLTDAEFVAYLTNDFSIIDYNKESMNFIEQNFPIRPLNHALRDEIAYEILLRRTIQEHLGSQVDDFGLNSNDQFISQRDSTAQQQAPMRLARQVVDELISDVGLSIGKDSYNDISDNDQYETFSKISKSFHKVYSNSHSRSRPSFPQFLPEIDESQMLEERNRRYEQFKENYGKFKAWFIKEQWNIDNEEEKMFLLNLADMSWHDIKVTLFKICCLDQNQLASLAADNSTLYYLASNYDMCRGSNIDSKISSEEFRYYVLYFLYSVHFNKHHTDLEVFHTRLSTFKANVMQIQRLSCQRSLTTYRSLKRKNLRTMNTIDILDPRRSYTDDINLDRFEYFSIPKLDGTKPAGRSDVFNRPNNMVTEPPGFERLTVARNSLEQYKAMVSNPNKKSFFSIILDSNSNRDMNSKLRESSTIFQNMIDNSNQTTSTHRVYDIVKQRYRVCLRTLKNEDPDENYLRLKQCDPSGRFEDRATAPSWRADIGQPSLSHRLMGQNGDQCGFYWMGLEPWSEGLLSQDDKISILIQTAQC